MYKDEHLEIILSLSNTHSLFLANFLAFAWLTYGVTWPEILGAQAKDLSPPIYRLEILGAQGKDLSRLFLNSNCSRYFLIYSYLNEFSLNLKKI